MWFMTIVSLDKNGEWKMSSYYSQLVMSNNINENLIVYATYNVVHKWLNMWCFVQLELWLYVIVKNVHVLGRIHFSYSFSFKLIIVPSHNHKYDLKSFCNWIW
jgi:hypothetical protein